MADQRSLSPIPHNAPANGPGLIAAPVRVDLGSAQALLEMAQIPVVSQNSQDGESF
jgi:hypothetical protein